MPHGGGEIRVTGRRGWLASKPARRGLRARRRYCAFVGLAVVPPRSPAHPATHRICDADTTPVEVAVVAEVRASGPFVAAVDLDQLFTVPVIG